MKKRTVKKKAVSLASALETETNVAFTANSAVSLASTLDNVLDFFAHGGAMRSRSERDIESVFSKAYGQDKTLALRALFYMRDIRGGQGERRLFRVCLRWLAEHDLPVASKVLHLVPEYGRWDDVLLSVEGTELEDYALGFMKEQWNEDIDAEKPSIALKWFPSEQASNKKIRSLARKTAAYFGLSAKDYRQGLSYVRNKIGLVETAMCQNKWGKIDYSKVPSKASMNYRKAFSRHDPEGYVKWLEDVKAGKKKINAKALYPYEIVRPLFSYPAKEDATLDAQWDALPNYFEGKENSNILVVADVSGSMSGLPIMISTSLALYCAEHNEGEFHNKFLTFSATPELVNVVGHTLSQKINNISRANWDMNTNLQATFDLILRTAVKNKIPQSQMPVSVLIISDMQFDESESNYYSQRNTKTNFEVVDEKFRNAGYERPQLVFWNVNAFNSDQPVSKNEQGVVLCSGSSPSVIKYIFFGTVMTPLEQMLEVLNNERYSSINA